MVAAYFQRLGTVLRPSRAGRGAVAVLNPGCARLRDGALQLYPRIVTQGNVSSIGSFRGREGHAGRVAFTRMGIALQPEADYEFHPEPGGYGCEDPRVTFVPALDGYVMAYVALGPDGPAIALAVSYDGLHWNRLGPVRFFDDEGTPDGRANKDAAFFPEPVLSPRGMQSLALYHRPTLEVSVRSAQAAVVALKQLPPEEREGISVAYVPLDDAVRDVRCLCRAYESHRLALPPANWGTIKTGAGAPPVRIAEGWLSIMHGVDELEKPAPNAFLKYCAGIVIHHATHVERVLYRSPEPLFEAKLPSEVHGVVGYVVFPTGLDPRGERTFDVYYGMGDDEVGRGRLTLGQPSS